MTEVSNSEAKVRVELIEGLGQLYQKRLGLKWPTMLCFLVLG
jgi:hypothetical protein